MGLNARRGSLSHSESRIIKRSISDDPDDEYYDYDYEPEEVGQAATIEEQLSSLRNETQTKKETLTRLEAFFEELERRILRLEEANNGTRGVTESVHESMTSPAPETTTNLPCCNQIKLKSRNTRLHSLQPFLGVYDILQANIVLNPNENVFEGFSQEGTSYLSNIDNQNELVGWLRQSDAEDYELPALKFVSGFTGSCITGPKLYTVRLIYNEDMYDEVDSPSIVCAD